jgi:hypothetical protein
MSMSISTFSGTPNNPRFRRNRAAGPSRGAGQWRRLSRELLADAINRGDQYPSKLSQSRMNAGKTYGDRYERCSLGYH